MKRWETVPRRFVPFLLCLVTLPAVLGSAGDGAYLRGHPEDQLTSLSVGVLHDLSFLALEEVRPSTLLERARHLVGTRSARLLASLDADDDGALTFAEVLEADLPMAAHGMAHVDQGGRERAVGSDEALHALTGDYLRALEAALGLGVANETELPRVPIRGMKGEGVEMIDGVARASLRMISDRVADLDVRPFPDGDMTDPDFVANQERKLALMSRMDSLRGLLDAGRAKALVAQLRSLRAMADGAAQPPDLIVGRAAEKLVGQIDELLLLLPQQGAR